MAQPAPNEIYQFSIISALMDGVASHGIPISSLLAHGDHGLGTFRAMDGEMIILDSSVYQMKADGSIVPITSPDKVITPFGVVTRFEPTQRVRASISGKGDLAKLLKGLFPGARNHFVSIRMDGTFRKIHARTAGGQERPREGMVSVASRQTTYTFEDVKGTIFGFRCPEYVMGINVAGEHMHFISEDRLRGGHILGFETEGGVEVGVAMASRFHMELPTEDEEFNEAALGLDSKGIAAVEG
ncbi:alpha-acetolactate decarboxylase [Podospora aff. communis PSN243]|uniref:Alpha-acetolactate decarboxylase n=1 Tax=Podospora aff. communis PSN243 TaxID=3040156 RepID=A0AAV9G7K0_9PEZI|nr:alpha-acetolactate decarboxylase [Podospora aff. communis PSN243]